MGSISPVKMMAMAMLWSFLQLANMPVIKLGKSFCTPPPSNTPTIKHWGCGDLSIAIMRNWLDEFLNLFTLLLYCI